MTKKKLLVGSCLISALLLVVNMVGTFRLCGGVEYSSCMDVSYEIALIFLPVIPLFLFSLITFKMREEIFQAWWKFARVWVPVSMLAILISPSYTHNWMFPIEKGSVAFFVSVVFIIASSFIIVSQYLQKQKG